MSALKDTSYASEGPTLSNSSTVVPLPSPIVKALQINSGYAPSSSEDDEVDDLRNPKDELRKKRILKRQISKEAGGIIYHMYMIYVKYIYPF